MYLNYSSNFSATRFSLFNYNMGCIWMYGVRIIRHSIMGLTITWDVFEYHPSSAHPNSGMLFNYNMGCIWMILYMGQLVEDCPFNYNMGCIWMSFADGSICFDGGLTITWDVFESPSCPMSSTTTSFNYNMGCIWMDRQVHEVHGCKMFNYNMGCIWIIPIPSVWLSSHPFNYNMGCIWMRSSLGCSALSPAFNYNMGCIWILSRILPQAFHPGLTITWDVFEYHRSGVSVISRLV